MPRILIAEDNPAVRTALRSLLQSAGPWEIVEVESGLEALAKAQELRPNLMILDRVMPVMDGLSAARQISKLLPEIPMLMHTMHWSPQIELEAQKAVSYTHLTPPTLAATRWDSRPTTKMGTGDCASPRL